MCLAFFRQPLASWVSVGAKAWFKRLALEYYLIRLVAKSLALTAPSRLTPKSLIWHWILNCKVDAKGLISACNVLRWVQICLLWSYSPPSNYTDFAHTSGHCRQNAYIRVPKSTTLVTPRLTRPASDFKRPA